MIATYNNLLFEKIEFNQGELDSQIIKDLIKTFEPDRERMIGLWNKYKGVVPILEKTMPDSYKKNNKLANDFRGIIVTQVVGYLWGIPIVYTFDQSRYDENQSQNIKLAIEEFNKTNNIEQLDSITGEYASVCGYGSRLFYIDINGILRTMNVAPWETIFVYDPTIDKMMYSIIYYQIDYYDLKTKTYSKRWKVELYDDTNVSFYFEYEKNKFELDPDEPKNPTPHMFNDVPVVKFNNNTLNTGDFESVQSLIDSYDLLTSNAQDELDEFRLAYLAIIGGQITDDDVKRARQTGVFQNPEGVDIKFITKELPTAMYDSQAKKLKENIFALSSTLDFSDQVFSGNAESGLARRLKFQSLESKSIIKERNYSKALFDQYNLLTDIWEKKKIKLNPYDMQFIFGRDLPIDIMYYAQAGALLTGQVSEETKLSLFPFIPDPSEELKRLDNERNNSGPIIDLNILADEPINEPTGSV